MNETVTARGRLEEHSRKDLSFDICSLADQLHRCKSTLTE